MHLFLVFITVDKYITKLAKLITMGNILYVMAAILIGFWLIGYFAFGVGPFIHVLLGAAAIAVLSRLIVGNKIAD